MSSSGAVETTSTVKPNPPPTQHLFPEILDRILTFVISQEPTNTISIPSFTRSGYTPWILREVSSLWRQVVMNHHHDHYQIAFELLENPDRGWLERARSLAELVLPSQNSSVHVALLRNEYTYGRSTRPAICNAMQFFLPWPLLPRLTGLEVVCESPHILTDLLKILPKVSPPLQALKVNCHGRSIHGGSEWEDGMAPEPIAIPEMFGSLTSLAANTPMLLSRIARLHIPWTQLQVLNLSDEDRDPGLYGDLDPLELVWRCNNLVDCTLQLGFGLDEYRDIKTMPNLRSLCLRGTSTELLDLLHLPSLEKLEILHRGPFKSSEGRVIGVLRRSRSPLKHLKTGEFFRIIGDTDTTHSNMNPGFLDAISKVAPAIEAIDTEDLLDTSTMRQILSLEYFPALQVLLCHSKLWVDPLVDILDSRFKRSGFANLTPLREVNVICHSRWRIGLTSMSRYRFGTDYGVKFSVLPVRVWRQYVA